MELLPNRGNWPGLLKTYIVHRDEKMVVVNEEWDITVPGCPMVGLADCNLKIGDSYIKQTLLSPEEFAMHFEQPEEGKL